MKKKIMSLCLCLALAATAVGGTLAYFTDSEAEHNKFVVGEMDIELVEKFDDETPLMPGNGLVTKEVSIENEGTVPAYVRLLIAYEDTKDVGAMAWLGFNEPFATKSGPFPNTDMENNFVIPSNKTDDWLQITDGTNVYTVGYVTIRNAVAAGDSTGNILNGLKIKEGADNAWAEIVGDKYDVMVLAQGAQTIDGKNATESLEAAFGFKMDEKADQYVAQLFTQAGLGSFSAHTYTSKDAWVKSDAWQAVQDHPVPYIQNNGTEATVNKHTVNKQ